MHGIMTKDLKSWLISPVNQNLSESYEASKQYVLMKGSSIYGSDYVKEKES